MSKTRRILKRVIDLIFGAIFLALSLPIMALIAIAVGLDSRGPVFIVNERVGYRGVPFKIVKFRSMVPDADAVLRRHLRDHVLSNEEWNADLKLREDPRISRVGRLLRKLSLDELPQLFHVVSGRMSLVGPRPLLPEEVDRYGEKIRVIASVRPGLTGLWQVSGRNDRTYEERIALQCRYVEEWTIARDMVILARTLPAVVRGHGAY